MTGWVSPGADARKRLLQRVQRSVDAHRDYRTLRRDQQQWLDYGPGVRRALLAEHPVARVMLFRLDEGAALPWLEGGDAQEILVVTGSLRAGDGRLLPHWSYALRAAADAGALVADGGPASVYVRQLLRAPHALREPEAQWWRVPRAPLELVQLSQRRWRPNFPGVEVLPLWGTPVIASMLVRFAPGAGVPDHHHEVNEDCLMLDGEMYLGDILLQPGDYQLAPAGGGHFGECSDVGGTFFFHGAIDPVLVPPKPPQP